jgi:hypothetical protein
MVGVIAVLPFAASACKIDVGNGCQVLIQEPGASFGLVCN